jgi:atypical dual specificity phosphatase
MAEQPPAFSWIDKPLLAALAWPDSPEGLVWLRNHGIELLISLTEDPPRRDWIDDAGLLVFHVPVPDMHAPTQDQLDRCLSAIHRAHERNMGVAVHCGAGMGRTGVILACYLVAKGLSANRAMARVRELRPGSIETDEQADSVVEFARRQKRG